MALEYPSRTSGSTTSAQPQADGFRFSFYTLNKFTSSDQFQSRNFVCFPSSSFSPFLLQRPYLSREAVKLIFLLASIQLSWSRIKIFLHPKLNKNAHCLAFLLAS